MKFVPLLILSALLASLAACAPRDEREIRGVIDDVERAAEARDAARVLSYLDERVLVQPRELDHAELSRLLPSVFEANPVVRLSVDVVEVRVNGDNAEADLDVRGIGLAEAGPGRKVRMTAHLVRQPGGWKIDLVNISRGAR